MRGIILLEDGNSVIINMLHESRMRIPICIGRFVGSAEIRGGEIEGFGVEGAGKGRDFGEGMFGRGHAGYDFFHRGEAAGRRG